MLLCNAIIFIEFYQCFDYFLKNVRVYKDILMPVSVCKIIIIMCGNGFTAALSQPL